MIPLAERKINFYGEKAAILSLPSVIGISILTSDKDQEVSPCFM
jgi:hypothetical protein